MNNEIHTGVRILIVDDDEEDFIITGDYIRHIPGTSYRIDWCYKYEQALRHMLDRNYDLYFVDYRMGAKSGVDLLREALSHNCTEPVVLLTGNGNYRVDMEAMQFGAVDYLVKTELSVEKMERCIRYALDRAASMKALKANERRYRSIFEKSKDLVFLADTQLHFRDVNDSAVQLLGYDKESIMSLSLYDLIAQTQHKNFLLQSLRHRKGIEDWEVILITRNGERKNCMLTASFEQDDNDETYVQGIIHDITNLKKAEKTTLQIEKMAAAGRLVRTLAHEVRNPLNNITLSVEQMMQDVPDEHLRLYMEIIQRNSKRIGDLISELLSTSHTPGVTLAPRKLQEVVDDVIAVAIDRITLRHIRLEVSYPETPVHILADGEKLKIALLNIVINAIEAMDEQGGELEILLQEKHPGYASLSIRDSGCGISEENISRLFEPYFTQKRNGVGLGLAFTLNILQAHKAELEVTSLEHKGTTFTITFQLADTLRERLVTDSAAGRS